MGARDERDKRNTHFTSSTHYLKVLRFLI